MRRYWGIYCATVVTNLIRELEFRANFIAKLFHGFGRVAFHLIIIAVLYRNVPSIQGWDRSAGLILSGTILWTTGLFAFSCVALFEFSEQVRKGTLDFLLTRPVDPQFSVTFRRIDVGRLSEFLSGIVMVVVGVRGLSAAPSPTNIAVYIALSLAALVIYYSINFFLATLAIYFVRTDNIWVVGEIMLESARYPTSIYPAAIQSFLTFVLPIAALSTIPSQALVFGSHTTNWVPAALWAFFGFIATRMFWRASLARYSSASS